MSLKRAFWGVFALMAVNYLVMILWSLPRLTVEGALPFDLRPAGYTVAEARAYLAGISDQARAFYLGPQHWLDTSYPALMTLCLGLAYHRQFPRAVAWGASALALGAATFDWLENAAVSAMLKPEPGAVTEAMIQTASTWTLWKSRLVSVALSVLIIGMVLRWWQKRRAA